MNLILRSKGQSFCLMCRRITSKQGYHDQKFGFDQMLASKKAKAGKTILIQHRLHRNPEVVLNFCEKYGPVDKMYTYQLLHREKDSGARSCALVEFKRQINVERVMADAKHFPSSSVVQFGSRYLFFHHARNRDMQRYRKPPAIDRRIIEQRDKQLQDIDLLSVKSVSDQLSTVYQRLSMSDLETALRFYQVSNLEEGLKVFLPSCYLMPFGSAVNGFGTVGGDLDIAMRIIDAEKSVPSFGGLSRSDQLYFMSKLAENTDEGSGASRGFGSRGTLDMAASMIQFVLPQYYHVHRIFSAKVPIVKFQHSGTGLECDLSLNNGAAILMSRYLYNLSALDPRVGPLVFAVRLWAKNNQVTYSNPGGWLSNFMLTLLVIHYLQACSQPILPGLAELENSLSSAKPLVTNSLKNTDNLDDLLEGFFAYYSSFDFAEAGISLMRPELVSKPDSSIMYMENPTELERNVCRNVAEEYLGVFQDTCQESLKVFTSARRDVPSVSQPWGLMKVLKLQDNIVPAAAAGPVMKGISLQRILSDDEKEHNDADALEKESSSDVDLESTGISSSDVVEHPEKKHPVSLLIELCSKYKWDGPHFDLVHESGPKEFLYKVTVNNQSYQPSSSSTKKTVARAEAANVCLKLLQLQDQQQR